MSTNQGRHIQALRDRARRPDDKYRGGRANDARAAIEAELDDYLEDE
jgi:hypothetical protein